MKRAACSAALALAATGLACGEDDKRAAPAINGLPGVRLEQVADRVENLRGLEFERLPQVEVLDQELLEERLEDAERERVRQDPDLIEREERSAAAEEALLFLLGLIDSESDVKQLETSDDLEVGGVYLEDQKRVYLERGAVRKDRERGEGILAHELAHALEDQHFGISGPRSPFSERAQAVQALAEGSARVVEVGYADRHLGASPADTLLDRRERRERHAQAPPGLRPALAFPYSDGASFVTALRDAGGRDAVDRAFRRPPDTTEQILHPRKWIQAEGALPTAIPKTVDPGKGWRTLARGDMGELGTRMILATVLPAKEVNKAASGWGGGRFQTWYRRSLPTLDCSQACRRRAVALLAWTWDDGREAAEFRRALDRYLRQALRGAPARGDAWALPDGAAATTARGNRITLALAPGERLAERLAADSLQEGR